MYRLLKMKPFTDIWKNIAIHPSSATLTCGSGQGRLYCRNEPLQGSNSSCFDPASYKVLKWIYSLCVQLNTLLIWVGAWGGRHMLLLATPYILLERSGGRVWPTGPESRLLRSCSPPHDLISSSWKMSQAHVLRANACVMCTGINWWHVLNGNGVRNETAPWTASHISIIHYLGSFTTVYNGVNTRILFLSG